METTAMATAFTTWSLLCVLWATRDGGSHLVQSYDYVDSYEAYDRSWIRVPYCVR